LAQRRQVVDPGHDAAMSPISRHRNADQWRLLTTYLPKARGEGQDHACIGTMGMQLPFLANDRRDVQPVSRDPVESVDGGTGTERSRLRTAMCGHDAASIGSTTSTTMNRGAAATRDVKPHPVTAMIRNGSAARVASSNDPAGLPFLLILV